MKQMYVICFMTHYYFMVNVAHFITLRKLLQATMNSFFWKKAVYSFIYFVSFSVAWHHDTSFVQSKAKFLSAFKIEEVVCGFCQCFLLFVSVFYPKKNYVYYMQRPKWFKFSLEYRSEFCQHIQDLKKKLEG